MTQENNVQETEVRMAQEENTEAPKAVHHATVKGANLAVARKEISADSCRAVIAGEITLQRAKAYGRDLVRQTEQRMADEEAKRQEKTKAKAEKQRAKEGEDE